MERLLFIDGGYGCPITRGPWRRALWGRKEARAALLDAAMENAASLCAGLLENLTARELGTEQLDAGRDRPNKALVRGRATYGKLASVDRTLSEGQEAERGWMRCRTREQDSVRGAEHGLRPGRKGLLRNPARQLSAEHHGGRLHRVASDSMIRSL